MKIQLGPTRSFNFILFYCIYFIIWYSLLFFSLLFLFYFVVERNLYTWLIASSLKRVINKGGTLWWSSCYCAVECGANYEIKWLLFSTGGKLQYIWISMISWKVMYIYIYIQKQDKREFLVWSDRVDEL